MRLTCKCDYTEGTHQVGDEDLLLTRTAAWLEAWPWLLVATTVYWAVSSVVHLLRGWGEKNAIESSELHTDLQFSKAAGCIFIKRLIQTATFAVAKCSSTACVSLIGTAPPDSVWRDAACMCFLSATWPKYCLNPRTRKQAGASFDWEKQVKRLCQHFNVHFCSRWIQEGFWSVCVGLHQLIILWLMSLQHQLQFHLSSWVIIPGCTSAFAIWRCTGHRSCVSFCLRGKISTISFVSWGEDYWNSAGGSESREL